jgi:hypothetical protein
VRERVVSPPKPLAPPIRLDRRNGRRVTDGRQPLERAPTHVPDLIVQRVRQTGHGELAVVSQYVQTLCCALANACVLVVQGAHDVTYCVTGARRVKTTTALARVAKSA